MTKKVFPELRSQPLAEKLQLPDRAEILPKIDSGEIDHLDFRARVFQMGENRNSYKFRQQDMPSLASSFEGQPFLRNHDSFDIGSRDGTILSSTFDGQNLVQDIRLTTRRGMTDFVEGKIDRFSIGWWDYKDITCNICNDQSFLGPQCMHWPGRTYDTPSGKLKCEITFIQPMGKETSAVNTPAVPGTGIEAALETALEFKMSILGDEIADAKERAAIVANNRQEPVVGEDTAALAQERQGAVERKMALNARKPIFMSGEVMNNVREMMKKRAGLIEQASQLHELAEVELRDLTADEHSQFGQLMDEADALEGQIKTIQDERARLRAAQNSLDAAASVAEKPEPAAQSKVMKRSAFGALSPAEQSTFIRSGGRLSDD
jgi:hypothetical protein